MYGDEDFIWAFEQGGVPVVQQPRSNATVVEYPVVADVDNDGSAEIIVGSSPPSCTAASKAPTRPCRCSRTPRAAGFRPDGSGISPQFEPKHWLELNTFRTNAQIENGGVCDPVG